MRIVPAAAAGTLFPDRAGWATGVFWPALGRRKDTGALFFENPRNTFRTGPAFVAVSCPVECMETQRGRFFGKGAALPIPTWWSTASLTPCEDGDNRPIAAILTTLNIPAHGERTVVVVLGQADDRARAEAVIRKYQDLDAALASLQETRRWWLGLMDTVRARTSKPEFDGYLDWLNIRRWQSASGRGGGFTRPAGPTVFEISSRMP